MAKFYTSDLHVFHKKIVSFTNRGEETTQENHEQWLVNLWNSQVKAGDLVYVLGDVSFGKLKQTKEILTKLNGQIIIVKGNHDRTEDLIELEAQGYITKWYQYKEIKIGETTVVLFHFPISSWHKQHHDSWHLHGHSHGAFQGQGKILDVGIDSAYNIFGEHKLFSENDIVALMQQKEKFVAEQHRNRVE